MADIKVYHQSCPVLAAATIDWVRRALRRSQHGDRAL